MVPAGRVIMRCWGEVWRARQMLTAKLQNRSGVLNRFAQGLVDVKSENTESISVGATETLMYRGLPLSLMLLRMMK